MFYVLDMIGLQFKICENETRVLAEITELKARGRNIATQVQIVDGSDHAHKISGQDFRTVSFTGKKPF